MVHTQVQPFEHVVIFGVGLLGASLGLALKKHRLARVITGVGRAESPSLSIAKSRGAIDHASTDLPAAARDADLVVLCTPIRKFRAALQALAPVLQQGTIITDVGSTKADVVRWAEEVLPSTVHFVGSHPMAGSEKSGPEAARDNLYHNAVCLVCPPPSPAGQDAFVRVRDLWKALGMRLIELAPDVHDRWVATISHLPHAAAFALVNAAAREPQMLEAVAGGFLDTTRVASSDVSMWTDIFLTNQQAVLESLDLFSTELAALRAAIAAGDEPALRDALARAKKSRDDLLARRQEAGLSTRSHHTPPSREVE